jgi:hypothetical protein
LLAHSLARKVANRAVVPWYLYYCEVVSLVFVVILELTVQNKLVLNQFDKSKTHILIQDLYFVRSETRLVHKIKQIF